MRKRKSWHRVQPSTPKPRTHRQLAPCRYAAVMLCGGNEGCSDHRFGSNYRSGDRTIRSWIRGQEVRSPPPPAPSRCEGGSSCAESWRHSYCPFWSRYLNSERPTKEPRLRATLAGSGKRTGDNSSDLVVCYSLKTSFAGSPNGDSWQLVQDSFLTSWQPQTPCPKTVRTCTLCIVSTSSHSRHPQRGRF
jgi:hypothetical protein